MTSKAVQLIQLLRSSKREKRLGTVILFVTSRCNAFCQTCFYHEELNQPGDLTFAHVRAFIDRVVTVDDAAIARAALWLFHEAKLVVEPSGAATVAAVLWPSPDSPLADTTRKTVAILSGGNVSPETLAALEK